jgi:hypothetical protein
MCMSIERENGLDRGVPETERSNGSSRERTQRGSGEERTVTVRSSARAMAMPLVRCSLRFALGLREAIWARSSLGRAGPGQVALPEYMY